MSQPVDMKKPSPSGGKQRGYTATRCRRSTLKQKDRSRTLLRKKERDLKEEFTQVVYEGVDQYLPLGLSLVDCLKNIFTICGACVPWTKQEEDTSIGTDSLFTTWQSVMDGPLRRKISTAISLLVAMGLCKATGSTCNIDFRGFTLFSATVEERHCNAFDFIAAFTDTVVFFSSRIVLSIQNGSLIPFAFNDATAAEITNKVTKLKLYIEALGAGNHEKFYDVSQRQIEQLLVRTTREVCELESNVRGLPRTAMTRLRVDLEHLKSSFTIAVKEKGLRPVPFAFAVYGPSGVGKSSVAELVTHVALKAMKIDYTASDIVTRSLTDEYDSDIKADTKAVRFDDVGNSVDSNDVSHIIRFVNNVPCTAVMADVERKGTISISPKVVAVTTNLPDMGAYQGSRCPASITRRMNCRITPVVKPEFRNGDALDPAKVLKTFGSFSVTNDLWDFLVDLPTVTTDDKGRSVAGWKPYGTRDTYTLAQLIELIAIEAVAHKDKQEQIVNMQDNLVDLELCDKCRSLSSMCTCKTVLEGPVDDILHPVFKFVEKRSGNVYKRIYTLVIGAICSWLQTMVDKIFFQIFDVAVAFTSWKSYYVFVLKQYKYSVPYFLFMLFLTWLLPAIGFLVLVFSLLAAEFVRRRSRKVVKMEVSKLLATVNDYCMENVLGKVLFGTLGMSLLLVIYQSWNKFRARPVSEGVETPENVSPLIFDQNKIVRTNIWAKHYEPVAFVPEPCRTSTGEQMSSVVGRHCVVIDGLGTDDLPKGLVLCNNLIVIPNHLVRTRSRDVEVEFCRGDRSIAGTVFRVLLCFSKKLVCLNNDACFVPFSGGPTFGNIIDRFANGGRFRKIECVLLDRKPTGLVDVVMTQANFAGPEDEVYKYVAPDVPEPNKYLYKWDGHYVGACGSPLVKYGKDPRILGMHTFTTYPTGVSGVIELTHDFISTSVAKMDLHHFRTDVTMGSVPETIMGKTVYEGNGEFPHDKSPLRYVPDGHFTFMGTVGGRVTPRSKVVKTGVYNDVLENLGTTDNFGPPPYNSLSGDQPWFTFQDALMRKCDRRMLPINSRLLDEAATDYLRDIYAATASYDGEYYALSDADSIFGIDGDPYHNGVDFSTSVGFPLTGPKRAMLSDPYWDGRGDKPDVDPTVLAEVRRMEECYRAGHRANVIWKATPKDEPTLNTKNKVRIFCSANMPMTIFWKKYTESILAFIRRYNYTCETAVGLNAHSADWDDITNFLRGGTGDNSIYGGDYSCYDDMWHAQLTTYAMDVFLGIGRALGMPDDIYQMLRVASTDIITPLIAWNGDLIMLHSSWVSGFLLTCDVGGIANSLLNRCAAFSHNGGPFRFRDHVRLLTTGDDHIGGVSAGSTHLMNHNIMLEFLTQHGIKYTMPDKRSAHKAFVDLSETDFLKRGFVFNQDTQSWFGPLDLQSIVKSLTWCVKSSKITQRERDAAAMDAALRELFFHGRSIHDDWQARIELIARKHGLLHLIPSAGVSYDCKMEEYIKANQSDADLAQSVSSGASLSDCTYRHMLGTELADDLFPIQTLNIVHSPSTKGDQSIVGPNDNGIGNDSEKTLTVYEGVDSAINTAPVVDETLGHTLSDQPVHLDEIPAVPNTVRSIDMNDTSDFDKWLNTPVQILSTDVAVGTRVDLTLDPWDRMFANPMLAKKLSGHRLFTCDGIEIKFVLKGSPFMSGKIMVSVDWGFAVDAYRKQAAPIVGTDSASLASNKPLVFLDPTTSNGATVHLPLVIQERAIDLTSGDLPPSSLRIVGTGILRHVNNGTAPLSLVAYAHFVNPQIGGRTTQGTAYEGRGRMIQGLQRTAHRLSHAVKKGVRVAEDVLTTAERVADMTMKNVLPVIPELAQAGATMLACAGLDSRVVNPDSSHYHASAVGDMTSLAKTSAFPLTADPKAQLGVSSALLGFDGQDHMAFSHIFSHWHYMTDFTIDPLAVGRGDVLFSAEVGPVDVRALSAATKYCSGATFIAQFFKYWRGAYEYRFVVSRATSQRMAFRIVYDPFRIDSGNLHHNNVMSTVFDIIETTDHAVVVPYEQSRLYQETTDIRIATPRFRFDGAHFFASDSRSNGVISLIAETACTSMNASAIDDGITISVLCRPVAGEFTFTCPQNHLGDVGYQGKEDEGDPSLHEGAYQATHGAYTFQHSDGIPEHLPMMAGTENFFTLADLIHRQSFLEMIQLPGAAAVTAGTAVRHRFPPAVSFNARNSGMASDRFTGGNTALAALSLMYTFRRGNVVGTIVPLSNQSDPAVLIVNRTQDLSVGNEPLVPLAGSQSENSDALFNVLGTFADGSVLGQSSVNETVTYDAPDCTNRLCEYNCINLEDADDFNQQQSLSITRVGTFNESTPLLHFVAGGDTMRFYGYVGPPIITVTRPPPVP